MLFNVCGFCWTDLHVWILKINAPCNKVLLHILLNQHHHCVVAVKEQNWKVHMLVFSQFLCIQSNYM